MKQAQTWLGNLKAEYFRLATQSRAILGVKILQNIGLDGHRQTIGSIQLTLVVSTSHEEQNKCIVLTKTSTGT